MNKNKILLSAACIINALIDFLINLSVAVEKLRFSTANLLIKQAV